MLAAVEPLPGHAVGQPEVGAAVDHHGLGGQRLRDHRGLAVRKTEEDHVVPGEHLDGGLLEHPVGQRHQVRLQAAEPLPGVRAGGHRPDLDLRVPQQQPEHLTSGVPARAGDGDSLHSHVHDHTGDCIYLRIRGQARCTAPCRATAERHGGVPGRGGVLVGQGAVGRPEPQRERQRLVPGRDLVAGVDVEEPDRLAAARRRPRAGSRPPRRPGRRRPPRGRRPPSPPGTSRTAAPARSARPGPAARRGPAPPPRCAPARRTPTHTRGCSSPANPTGPLRPGAPRSGRGARAPVAARTPSSGRPARRATSRSDLDRVGPATRAGPHPTSRRAPGPRTAREPGAAAGAGSAVVQVVPLASGRPPVHRQDRGGREAVAAGTRSRSRTAPRRGCRGRRCGPAPRAARAAAWWSSAAPRR